MMQRFIVMLAALVITGCGTLKPSTITDAVIGHATFPSLSVAVQECVSDEPDVRAMIVDPFNRLVDQWSAAGDLEPDASLIVALAGAQNEVRAAKRDWSLIKATIVDAGIDCGPAVASQVANIEQTFGEIESAILSNERAVYALEWGQLLASVVLGNRAKVVRMQ